MSDDEARRKAARATWDAMHRGLIPDKPVEEVARMSETCGDCRYWHQHPADPANLSAERPGECRGGPPALVAVPVSGGLGVRAFYPVIPGTFPACGSFASRARAEALPGWRAWLRQLADLEGRGDAGGFVGEGLRSLLASDYNRSGEAGREEMERACDQLGTAWRPA